MAIGNKDREFAEKRFDADAPEYVTWSANLNSGRMRIIRNDLAMREGKKASKEVGNTYGRNIDTVLGNCLKRRVCGFSCVPVQLHVDSAWPLNDCIASNRIRERRHKDISPRRRCGNNSTIEIGDKIASPLCAEGIRNRSLEPKQRHCAYRSLQKLGTCTARSRCDCDNDLRCAGASERAKEGLSQGVTILWRAIDVRCIVLWTAGDTGSRFRRARFRQTGGNAEYQNRHCTKAKRKLMCSHRRPPHDSVIRASVIRYSAHGFLQTFLNRYESTSTP